MRNGRGSLVSPWNDGECTSCAPKFCILFRFANNCSDLSPHTSNIPSCTRTWTNSACYCIWPNFQSEFEIQQSIYYSNVVRNRENSEHLSYAGHHTKNNHPIVNIKFDLSFSSWWDLRNANLRKSNLMPELGTKNMIQSYGKNGFIGIWWIHEMDAVKNHIIFFF